MSISYEGAIIHVLDLAEGQPILSKGLLDIDDENEKFITKHIMNLFDNIVVSEAEFREESNILDLIVDFADDKFIEVSKRIASRFFTYMTNYGNITAGDLLITSFTKEEVNYLGILKLNYKEEFAHKVNYNNGNGGVTEIIKHTSILPSKQKVTEAILINLDTRQLRVLDKSKDKYISELFEIEKFLSTKEKLQVIEDATYEVIEEYFDNSLEAHTTFKQHVADAIFENNEIPIQNILDKTFEEYEEVKEACNTRFTEYGLKDDTIVMNNNVAAKKYASHQIKTSNGIEIKLPTSLVKDSSVIEFIQNPDGTTNIVLKNISELISK
ncbi:MAG: hypothetical protein BEN19_07195 [Epulopiscium sp. Nuni2H_MBin003]|nr:MAG: hypothetical protein BEN19_07195 [Epulopiscium sp. Nuni2H_MBin003]